MKYTEIQADLFEVSKGEWKAHCISSDIVMGAGIAKTFVNVFNEREIIKKNYPDYYNKRAAKFKNLGYDLLVDKENKVFNLVTKELVHQKPTYSSLAGSLYLCKIAMEMLDIHKLYMPKIGCGLDGLEWNIVSKLIVGMFEFSNIEITVCYL